jgi:flagellar hook assembly protein FlgD
VRILGRDGRLVRTFTVPGGASFIDWDGRDESGRKVPAGVYFCGITGTTRTEPVVFLGGAR